MTDLKHTFLCYSKSVHLEGPMFYMRQVILFFSITYPSKDLILFLLYSSFLHFSSYINFLA